jgi:hypothetical protein
MARGTHLRLVHDAAAARRRLHDARVFEVEQGIMREVAVKHREFLTLAAKLVSERLAPIDSRAAGHLLHEIQVGDLP